MVGTATKKSIRLECTICKNRNYRFVRSTGGVQAKKKLELKKYCKWCQKHTPHTEAQ